MKLQLALGLGLGAQSQRRNNDMILVYEIPSDSTKIELAIQANSTWFSAGQAVVINWGDGSAAETVSATSGHTGYIWHTYASAGTYTIKISGSMTMYGRTGDVDIAGQTLLTRVDSFGRLGITSLAYAFYRCTGLTSVPKILPSTVTDMYYMFQKCSGAAFNPDVSNWDVSKVTSTPYMFRDCSGDAFNPNVTNWNVSKSTNMNNMFDNCRGAAFNPDVSNWDVSKVASMYAMFRDCRGDAFNPNVTNWNVSKSTIMNNMFDNCRGAAFNPDVSNWDVSKVTTMISMFARCSGAAFRGGRGVSGNGIANWRLRMSGVNMGSFMSSSKTQEPAFLDEILNAWAALHADGQLPTNITVDFGTNNKYTAAGSDAYATLTAAVANGGAAWTIASGGLQA